MLLCYKTLYTLSAEFTVGIVGRKPDLEHGQFCTEIDSLLTRQTISAQRNKITWEM